MSPAGLGPENDCALEDKQLLTLNCLTGTKVWSQAKNGPWIQERLTD
jgi:hypothetical protein